MDSGGNAPSAKKSTASVSWLTAGLPPVTRTIPAGVAYTAGWMFEVVYKALRLKSEPRMTRFLARELSTAHWFNLEAARRDLGFEPAVSLEEGMKRLKASLANH